MPRIGTLALAVSAACGSPSRGQQRRPSLSGRQVLLFHASACDELTPPIHRAPPGPHTGSSPTEGPPRRAFVPGPPTDPSFDAIVVSFRCVSSGSHMFVFSSHTRPATARRQPQRSPPRLLTDAACGGLESPPARRPRRTYLHHWHSTDRADDLLHHRHHFPSGHTVSAENSAVGVDVARWGPTLSPRVPNLVPIPGPRMERETPGQRPRPNYGHPHAAWRSHRQQHPAAAASAALGPSSA